MKYFKYRAGVAIMLACWITGGYTLASKPKQHEINVIPAPAEPLPLPVWSDIIGIDLILFEPIPANHAIKQIEKKQGRQKKKK